MPEAPAPRPCWQRVLRRAARGGVFCVAILLLLVAIAFGLVGVWLSRWCEDFHE